MVCGDDDGWGDVSCVFCSRWEIFGGVEGFVRHQVGFAEAGILLGYSSGIEFLYHLMDCKSRIEFCAEVLDGIQYFDLFSLMFKLSR